MPDHEDIEVDVFTRAYLECALWSSTDNADDTGGSPLDESFGVEDIAAETLLEAKRDCEDFQEAQRDLLDQAYEQYGYSEASAGHDFWLTRNGHGAGFWDRGLGEVGEQLTQASHAYGSVELYVGDDGKVH